MPRRLDTWVCSFTDFRTKSYSGSAAALVSAVGQTYHFTPLSFAENMAAMVLFGLIIALAARSQLKVEKS